jgi:hypothetical protein
MRRLIAALDDDSFQRREAAMKQLQELGPSAEPALRTVLQGQPSPEQRRRVEIILVALAEPHLLSAEQLRAIRAVTVLEQIGSPEARQNLKGLAGGVAAAPLTRSARSALERMR